jgi:quercetin dioxygenase-like cupin family protein
MGSVFLRAAVLYGVGSAGARANADTVSCTITRMEHSHRSWDAVPLEVMSDVISRKIITGEKAMVAQVFISKNAVVPLHQHESEQITYILEGALKFELQGREVTVRKGEVLHIPSGVPHRAVALEDTVDLDIFSPIRLDWLEKNDVYLRRGESESPDKR